MKREPPLLVANTDYGKVIGKVKEFGDKSYTSFEGIPFAKPPLGYLRFRDPEPPRPWEYVLDCRKPSAVPIGNGKTTTSIWDTIGSLFKRTPHDCEDCLYLNVYTPTTSPMYGLPVVVFIYGGGFAYGCASKELYGPDFILEKDVILVTFNYRLSAFGFMTFQDETINIPGNAGLKDQYMALKWVKDNIRNFGGDQSNITVMGHGAGAASVHLHMISPLSKGLFNRAIMMSGSALCEWALRRPDKQHERELAVFLGWDYKNGEMGILKTIADVEPRALSALIASRLLTDTDQCFGEYLVSPFVPTVEPEWNRHRPNSLCFLPDTPSILGSDPWSASMDLIIGGLSEEGLMFYKFLTTGLMETLKEDSMRLLPMDVKLKGDGYLEKLLARAAELNEFYFGGSEPSPSNEHFLQVN